MEYRLRFKEQEVQVLARQYVAENRDQAHEDLIEKNSSIVKANGFYSRANLIEICHWKSPRTQHRCESNDEAYVHDVTSVALGTQNERLRIEVLRTLDGVDWPTASVLLHFGHQYPYPILDFRALSALSIPQPPAYDFKFWWNYVLICRGLAKRFEVSVRMLDRALWKYSQLND